MSVSSMCDSQQERKNKWNVPKCQTITHENKIQALYWILLKCRHAVFVFLPPTTCCTGMGWGAMGAGPHWVVDMVLFCQFCPPVSFFSPEWLHCISGLQTGRSRVKENTEHLLFLLAGPGEVNREYQTQTALQGPRYLLNHAYNEN